MGEVEGIETLLLETLLRTWEGCPELSITSSTETPCCKQGENYMSTITRIRLTTDKGGGGERWVVCKRPPPGEALRAAFRCDPAFRNEAGAYSLVLPALEACYGRSLPFPRCLHASTELIVLEDLKPRGYSMASSLTLQQAAAALKALGRLHGVSLAMGREELAGTLEEVMWGEAAGRGALGAALERALEAAFTALPSHLAARLAHLRGGRLFLEAAALVAPYGPLQVVCHGDFWTNNILFGPKPDDVILIDLQMMRWGCGTTDVLHLLYTSLGPLARRNGTDALLATYRSALVESAGSLAPSYSALAQDMARCALYGLAVGLLFLPHTHPTVPFHIAAVELVQEFVEKGYI